jgi:hypothetical protein
MVLTNAFYDTFVVQNYSKLTECRAKPVGLPFPHRSSWLVRYSAVSTFQSNPPPQKRALAFAVLRRVEAAVDDYNEACDVLERFFSEGRTISGYFRALRKFESAVAQVWQAWNFSMGASGSHLFKKNDGTSRQRLHAIYNAGRHDKPQELLPGQIQLVWLEDDGLHAQSWALTFEELHAFVAELESVADRFCTPE